MGFSSSEWGVSDAPSSRGRPDAAPSEGGEFAYRMVEQIIRTGPNSHAEALKQLRAAFPDSPLTVRVAALAILMRRGAGDHVPR
jgi:hypothetical protein